MEKINFKPEDFINAEWLNKLQDTIISIETAVGTANDVLESVLSEGV